MNLVAQVAAGLVLVAVLALLAVRVALDGPEAGAGPAPSTPTAQLPPPPLEPTEPPPLQPTEPPPPPAGPPTPAEAGPTANPLETPRPSPTPEGDARKPLVIAPTRPLARGFDVEDLGITIREGPPLQYDLAEFSEIEQEQPERIRAVAVPDGSPVRAFLPTLLFTVSNASTQERAIITSVGVILEEFASPPDALRVGCEPGRGGTELVGVIPFDVRLEAGELGAEQRVAEVPAEGTVLELGPNDLQHFSAGLAFADPGLYAFRVLVHYDTSAGRSTLVSSETVEVLVMPPGARLEPVEALAGSPAPTPTNLDPDCLDVVAAQVPEQDSGGWLDFVWLGMAIGGTALAVGSFGFYLVLRSRAP